MSKPRTIAEYPNRADDYDQAVSKSHDQNTDTVLDEGGDHEVTAEDIRGHVDSTENPHQVTAGQVGAYTKGEVGDLLDDKADQSALNATNQAVSALDGRVDTAEDDIQDLEEGKADANNPQFTGVFGYGQNVRMRYDNAMPSSPVILIAQANHPDGVDTVGGIVGYRRHSNTTNSFRLQFTAYAQYNASTAHAASSMTYKLDAGSYGNISAEPISCTYEGKRYFAVRITGSPVPNGYVLKWVGRTVSNSPLIVSADDISSIDSVGVGRTIYGQPVIVQGTVTTTDIITQSRVESDRENALRALDNISEWKKKDGTIDYKKHYAYTPRIIKDEKGKVIEEVPGLSMEKRVAMLEKMVAELSGELQNSKTQRK